MAPAGDPDLDARLVSALEQLATTEAEKLWRRRSDEAMRQLKEAIGFTRRNVKVGTGPTPKATRRRPLSPLPEQAIRETVEPRLRRRIAVLRENERRLSARPPEGPQKMPPHLTQDAIAHAAGAPFNRSRVQQGEKLIRLGWPLLKIHPEFSADGSVYWPSPKEAASILASERTG